MFRKNEIFLLKIERNGSFTNDKQPKRKKRSSLVLIGIISLEDIDWNTLNTKKRLFNMGGDGGDLGELSVWMYYFILHTLLTEAAIWSRFVLAKIWQKSSFSMKCCEKFNFCRVEVDYFFLVKFAFNLRIINMSLLECWKC